MGIARGAARLLLDECRREAFGGSVLQLGRQNVAVTWEQLQHWATVHGVALRPVSPRKSNLETFAAKNYVDDITFFTSLGFADVQSLDFSDFEGATHVADLNRPVPAELHDRYDVVFDGGTIEHVFHVPNVLENICGMLKVGGRIIHLSPASNHVDHGFYMFSPTLFYDYYSANGYEIVSSFLVEYDDNISDSWKVYRYNPGAIDFLSMGGFDSGTLLTVFFVAQKTAASTSGAVPQQRHYRARAWSGSSSEPAGSTKSAASVLLFGAGRNVFRRYPALATRLQRTFLAKKAIKKINLPRYAKY